DRQHVEVDGCRETAVQPTLVLAQGPPALGRPGVQERKVDRLLELVDVRTGQEDVRDVGLQVFHARRTIGMKGGIGEGTDDLRLPVAGLLRIRSIRPGVAGHLTRSTGQAHASATLKLVVASPWPGFGPSWCDPSTTRSARRAVAKRRISRAGSPIVTACPTRRPDAASDATARSTTSSARLRSRA